MINCGRRMVWRRRILPWKAERRRRRRRKTGWEKQDSLSTGWPPQGEFLFLLDYQWLLKKKTRWIYLVTIFLPSVSTSLSYTTTLTVASLTCTPSSFALSSCWNCLLLCIKIKMSRGQGGHGGCGWHFTTIMPATHQKKCRTDIFGVSSRVHFAKIHFG